MPFELVCRPLGRLPEASARLGTAFWELLPRHSLRGEFSHGREQKGETRLPYPGRVRLFLVFSATLPRAWPSPKELICSRSTSPSSNLS